MKDLYPRSFQELTTWCRSNGISANEGRERFVQYGVLLAISRSNTLRELLVFKGGNALDFIWLPNRSTQDLDFTARATQLDPKRLETTFANALKVAEVETGIRFRVQRVEQMPRGSNRTRATFRVSIGYALSDDHANQRRIDLGAASRVSLPVEVSTNEVVCAAEPVRLDPAGDNLMVATIEDIAAEKLRALLQQVTRNRRRKQDLLDLAAMIKQGTELNPLRLREFLRQKARAREIEPTTEAFRNEEVWTRAGYDYEQLKGRTRVLFVPFDEAKCLVLDLVNKLGLEEEEG